MRKMFTLLFIATVNVCFSQWSSCPTVNTTSDIQVKKEMVEIRIYDIHGKLLKQHTCKNELPIKLEVQQFESGMYFIQLSDGETNQKEKFIKQ